MKFLIILFLLPLFLLPVVAVDYREISPTDVGTLNIGIATIPEKPIPGEVTKFQIDFINPKTEKIQVHIDYKFTLQRDGENVFGPTNLIHTSEGSVTIPVEIMETGTYFVLIEIEGILFQPIPVEVVSFVIPIAEAQSTDNVSQGDNGGCLIATATYGSELSSQVQKLRELRDNIVLNTESGKSFMTGFNLFYYSFSPAIADFERENSFFRDSVKIVITPLLTSLSLLSHADIDSEFEMIVYGLSLIFLNVGMYFGLPAVIITRWYKHRIN
jgi:hypothetical protein